LSFSAENPRLRKAANRYSQYKQKSRQPVQGLKRLFFAVILAAFFLYSNRIYSMPVQNGVEATSSDFRFDLQLCDSSESSRCSNFKCLSMFVYSTINDSLIDKLYFCSDQDSLFTANFLLIGDYNFDGHTDFRILTKKSTTLVEKTRGGPEYVNDYDFYMFDVSSKKFYRHLISSLRQVHIDPVYKIVTGTLFNHLNNSPGSKKQPTSYQYKFNGEGLKYCTISPLSYPEPHQFYGNFAPTYHILDGRDLRPVTEADTLIITPTVKYESGFKFVKTKQLYPRKIDIATNPNISYRNVYRIYSLTNDRLLPEIIGEYEVLFGTRSDSIHTADCNFDGYPDLIIKDEQTKLYTAIYFYDVERQKFFEYPNIKHLEDLSIDFKRKTITGKNTAQAYVTNRYGQLRESKKKVWIEYEYIGPSLKYVKMQTITSTPGRGRKVKTAYYFNEYHTLKPIRKKEFLNFTNNM
jgi:hypothetical protein